MRAIVIDENWLRETHEDYVIEDYDGGKVISYTPPFLNEKDVMIIMDDGLIYVQASRPGIYYHDRGVTLGKGLELDKLEVTHGSVRMYVKRLNPEEYTNMMEAARAY